MPFTPSHAVVALPFIRTPLIPAAVAIGAMTPDLPLFLRGFGVTYAFTHTNGKVVWTGLIAFLLFLLWRVVLRPLAGRLAPRWVARRLPGEWDQPAWRAAQDAVGVGRAWWYPFMLAVSLLLGVISHILWDAFTHEGRAGSDWLPVLAEQWGPLAGYKWLQHGSSVVGLIIIGIWMLWWIRRAPVRAIPETTRLETAVRISWWVALPVILIGFWTFGYFAYGPLTAEFTVQHLAYRTLPRAAGIWAMLTLALCVVLTIWPGQRRTDAAAAGAPRG
ncbi:DUF4184 family protein [uncultured Microbacterium sp.]|uniref:DUF4184 family protein n=1 Tax=uncultured Microbacterium sp. TaxID=191216 RepID=UPI00262B50BF|nr:DUF4184 family protein [uncultured Microbacterium sp.]